MPVLQLTFNTYQAISLKPACTGLSITKASMNASTGVVASLFHIISLKRAWLHIGNHVKTLND